MKRYMESLKLEKGVLDTRGRSIIVFAIARVGFSSERPDGGSGYEEEDSRQ